MSNSSNSVDPTDSQFGAYRRMCDYFNSTLFGGVLRAVILNFSRAANTLGFFAPLRWEQGATVIHEISLNPAYLKSRSAREVASTLVHEMVHLWQQEHGKPGRRGYHNRQWAQKMEELGLMPSSTAAPGGERTGDRVSHYIIEGGAFARAFDAMPRECLLPWTCEEQGSARKKKPRSKVKVTCPGCDAAAWGKPGLLVRCGTCDLLMEGEDDGDAGEGEGDEAGQAALRAA